MSESTNHKKVDSKWQNKCFKATQQKNKNFLKSPGAFFFAFSVEKNLFPTKKSTFPSNFLDFLLLSVERYKKLCENIKKQNEISVFLHLSLTFNGSISGGF